MLCPLHIASLLVYVFLYWGFVSIDIKEKPMLLPVIFVVRVAILFMWLSYFRLVERLLSCIF
jgi:high-affinity Fe2+/Pb2+ permease